MIATLLALAATLAPGVTDADLVEAVFPLSAVLPQRGSDPANVRLLPLYASAEDTWTPWNWESALDSQIDGETIADLVRTAVAPEEWEFPGRSLDVMQNGRVLRVVASDAVVQQVGALLDSLAQILQARIPVRLQAFRVLKPGLLGELTPGPIDAADLARLEQAQAAGEALRQADVSVALATDRVHRHESLRRMPYLRDYEPEIAQQAAIAQPEIGEVEEGLLADLRADRCLDGSVLVSYIVRDTWLAGAPREVDVDVPFTLSHENGIQSMPAARLLQLPSVGFRVLASSVRLASGESRLAWVAAPGAPALLVVLSLGEVPALPALEADGRRLELCQVGGELSPGLHVESFTRYLFGLPWEIGDELLEPRFLRLPSPEEFDVQLLTDVLSEDEQLTALALGRTLAVMGSGDLGLERLARLGVGLDAELALSLRLPSGESLAGLSSSRGEALALAGVQSAFVAGYDVDVANGSAMADPTIGTSVDGLALRVGNDLAGGAELELIAELREGGSAAVDPQVATMGAIDLPRSARTVLGGHVTTGEATLGELLLPGGARAAVTVRVE